MCGVFGYVGSQQDVPLTVGRALKSLEYRGYDSWGIVWQDAGCLRTVKHTGKVPTEFTFEAVSRIAVGHTRWATHGEVTTANAHPHLDERGRVAIVHNGIIENAAGLRRLLPPGLRFQSQTDSEVVAHLLGVEIGNGRSVTEALRHVFPLLEGQNAVIAIDQDTETIAAAMNVSPLVIGIGEGGTCIASDPFALAGRATSMIIAPQNAVIELGGTGVSAIALDGTRLPLPDAHDVPDVGEDELGPYDTFMAKEMAEQPAVLRWQASDIATLRPMVDLVRAADTVVLTGCGSAFHAARLGASWLGLRAECRAMAVQASELAEQTAFLGPDTLVCAVTQSGETADVLEAMAIAQAAGATVVALTNVEHSSAARAADLVIALGAGRERSVLATKSLIAMLGRLMTLSSMLGDEESDHARSLLTAADLIEDFTGREAFHQFIEAATAQIGGCHHAYIIGKGDGFAVAQEAALKIKEGSYIHAEAFAAGELKHGAIALIEEGSSCLLFTTDERFCRDMASAANEVRSRGGYTMGIGPGFAGVTDQHLHQPGSGLETVLLQIVIAQTLARELARYRKLDPDYPRNLAKSVTVK